MNDERSPRERILHTTLELVEQKGYHATGINEIIKLSQTPKGSLYHYFPAGKADLVVQAIEMKATFIQERIRESLAEFDDPAEAIRHHLLRMADRMETMKCQGSWGPVAAVTLEATPENDELRQTAQNCFVNWQAIFTQKLLASGFSDELAETLSTTIVATIEGGIILSRAQQNSDPLRQIAETLAHLIRSYQTT